jgi:hypothetical protein
VIGSYRHLLVPGPDFLDERLGVDALAGIVATLERHGWIDEDGPAPALLSTFDPLDREDPPGTRRLVRTTPDPAEEVARIDVPLDPRRLGEDARRLQPTLARTVVTFDVPGLRGPSARPLEERVRAPRLTPDELVWGRVFACESLLALPLGDVVDRPLWVPCPSCGADVTRPLALLDPPERAFVAEVLTPRARWLGGRCPACKSRLSARSLAGRTRSPVSAAAIEVQCPFARLGIVLSPEHLVPLRLPDPEPALLADLRAATGIAFRSLGGVW